MVFEGILHDRKLQQQTAVMVYVLQDRLRLTSAAQASVDWALRDLEGARRFDDGMVILQSGSLFLEVRQPGFEAALRQNFPGRRIFRRTFFDKTGVTGCLVALLAIVLPAVAAYFWLAPVLADRAARKISVETEQRVGEQWYRSITAAYRIDSSRSRQLQQFYDALGFGGNYNIRVTVVQEPVVNAFALPGGHIVVFDSILGIMDAPEQLAALLAHEASHIQGRHSTRAIFRELAGSLFFSILIGDYADLPVVLARHSVQLASLSYSRSLELEADAMGFDLLVKSNLPPRGMPDLFQRMQNSPSGAAGPPDFLSTHPALEERIKTARDKTAALGAQSFAVSPELQGLWAEIHKR